MGARIRIWERLWALWFLWGGHRFGTSFASICWVVCEEL
jgi:hypothetical protein